MLDQLPPITLADLDAAILRKKRNRWLQMFPDEGPLRRELYPKHMEFIGATKNYSECAFIAGNRCITPWTYIGSNNQPSLVTLSYSNFDVQAWDGETLCNAQGERGFLKNISPAFRLVMDNGQFLDCTDEHLVLTSEGYLALDQLMSRASGLRLKRKVEDYQASCVADGYLCDLQLQSVKDSVLALFPKQDDALQFDQSICWLADEVAHISQYMRTSQELDLLSIPENLDRHAALFSQFLPGFCDKPVLPLSDGTLKFLQSVLESFPQESFVQFLSDQNQDLNLSQNEIHDISNKIEQLCTLYSIDRQSVLVVYQELQVQELYRDAEHKEIFFPFCHVPLIGDRKIVAVIPLGYQPIIDFEVKDYKNYLAGGIISHNTGKSETVVYAATCFLTGNYPPWWHGRRFNGPVNILAAGETAKLVRDSLQEKFIGPPNDIGTGMIPYDLIIERKTKPGIPDAVDIVRVRHVPSGGVSSISFQSYDQGREAFQATARHVILLDEEPPKDIYDECYMRTMTTKGLVMAAFTPLRGISEVVMSFMPDDFGSNK